jgi:hypothetical protein
MIRVVRYEAEQKVAWDTFVGSAKNALFLFERNYMEYHSNRFRDYSLMAFEDGRLISLMPANITEDTVHSHSGLTFGGLVSGFEMTTPLMMQVFGSLVEFLYKENVRKLVYKALPHIYHAVPSEEDLYALFRFGAHLVRRDVTSSVQNPALTFKENRLRVLKRAKDDEISVHKDEDFRTFMKIVQELLLKRHGVKPVHTSEEMELLASRFPDNIKLFGAFRHEVLQAGVLIFESSNVAHAQYIANTEDGRKNGALDLVFDFLINDVYREKKYFDFGISTENAGQHLNNGLVTYKESFRASAVVHDTYEIDLQAQKPT